MIKLIFIDICLQEFKGRGVKVVDKEYKLFHSGDSKPENGVGDIIANGFV